MKQKKFLVTFALGLCALTAAHAQDNDFDLGSQRSEVQLVNPVPGKKIDHQGLVINPTPRYVKLTGEGTVDVSGGVTLSQPFSKIKHSWDYWTDLNFLSRAEKGFPMMIQLVKIPVLLKDGEQSGADVDGAYTLRITKKGITIWADNDLGVFYGIQTLRQIMENPSVEGGKKLPCLEISDAPVFAYRGVVEGFYGTPWSHAVRLSLIDFYGKYKMNTYIYGPKDDPYHSSPNWRLPYPENEMKDIKELVAACKKNRVDFVWAIHP
ncbi:beta-N-acetylglucosaminidase domain-containing protein, partial [Prevotella jejuni]